MRQKYVEKNPMTMDEINSIIEGVNCRAIASELGCSTQPVFSRFPNMEELKMVVFQLACNRIEEQILKEENNHLEISIRVLADFRKKSNLQLPLRRWSSHFLLSVTPYHRMSSSRWKYSVFYRYEFYVVMCNIS